MGSALFRTASFLSMVLLAIAVALWVRGYFATDSLHASYHAHPYMERVETKHGRSMEYRIAVTTVTNQRGYIEATESRLASDRPMPQIALEHGIPRELSDAFDPLFVPPIFTWLGLELRIDRSTSIESIRVPTWMLVAVFSLLPLWRESGRYSKRRRSRANLCVECGYNLTSNTSGICPECGTKVPTTSIASHR